MEKYIFVLGNNPELSLAEIKAVYQNLILLKQGSDFAIFEGEKIDCQKAQVRLGGTIKIGKVIGEKLDERLILKNIIEAPKSGKVKFGFSWYETERKNKFGLVIKGLLKSKNIQSRFVESKDSKLSSVIVAKEKCLDFLILPDIVGLTCAVQDFRGFSDRDYGRPKSDSLSGMLPPKLARIMVNLSGADFTSFILDPFCGSGTILTEAVSLGYRNLKGSDISNKAVDDSANNTQWLIERLGIKKIDLEVFSCDSTEISQKIAKENISSIITEPFLGRPIKGSETEFDIKKIISQLKDLYLRSFKEFKKILQKKGKVVIVFPQWHVKDKIFEMGIEKEVEDLGFVRLDKGNLIYKRNDQKVWRKILIYEKK